MLDLVIAATPLDPVQITEAAHWHPRRENDPAVVWLRRLLYDVAVTVEDERAMSDTPVIGLDDGCMPCRSRPAYGSLVP